MKHTRFNAIIMGAMVVVALLASMVSWTMPVAEASTDWKKEYENSIGKKCPESNMKNQYDKYSYGLCQCTSYVAFRLARAGVKSSDFSYPGNGDAKNWVTRARERNIATGSEPKKGAVYVTQGGSYGHVMFVEEYKNGVVTVSEYNWEKQGNYGTRDLRGSAATNGTYIYFSNVGSGNGGGSNTPSTPRGLEIKDIKSNKAKIDWNSQSGVNYFCVNWSRNDSTPQGCDVRVKGSDSSYKPTDLRSNTTYYVWVQACNSSDKCSSAAKTKFKTKR
jgi:surface antigen